MSQTHTHPSQTAIGSPLSATRGNSVQVSNAGAHATHDAAPTMSTMDKEFQVSALQSFNQSFNAANVGLPNAHWMKK